MGAFKRCFSCFEPFSDCSFAWLDVYANKVSYFKPFLKSRKKTKQKWLKLEDPKLVVQLV